MTFDRLCRTPQPVGWASHINPVKHGLVEQVKDWPYSTFHKLVERGIYTQDWGGGMEGNLSYED